MAEQFRGCVKARFSYPASKAALLEYLKNHFDEDVNLSLGNMSHRLVQEISPYVRLLCRIESLQGTGNYYYGTAQVNRSII